MDLLQKKNQMHFKHLSRPTVFSIFNKFLKTRFNKCCDSDWVWLVGTNINGWKTLQIHNLKRGELYTTSITTHTAFIQVGAFIIYKCDETMHSIPASCFKKNTYMSFPSDMAYK